MTPQQLEELRQSLPPLAQASLPSPLLQEYCRFYGLDFVTGEPELEHRVGTVPSGDYRLAVHFWHQRGASHNLLIVHGYLDHTGLFGKLVEYGLSRNCNVLIFDLPGHGLSSGEPAVIDEFSHYSQAIADVLAAVPLPALPLWVMAQSTGSAALVDFAAKNPWPFTAAILLAPLVRPVRWLWVRLGHTLLHRFADSVHREFASNSADLDFLEFIQRDPLQSIRIPLRWVAALRRWLKALPTRDLGVGPALIIQGDADRTVAWRYNLKRMGELFPGSQVEILPGAGHQLANEALAMRQRYYEAIDRQLGFAVGTPSVNRVPDPG